MELKDIITIKGTIEVLTGLHIGGGNESIEIGGLDNSVIRDPFTKSPYIPGSSIKGKMRFLSEWRFNKVEEDGSIHECMDPQCEVCRIFGAMKEAEGDRGPTRLIVRDAHLSVDFEPEKMIEIKYGTAINRITGTAKKGSLRNMERVTPGTKFNLEISYRLFDINDGAENDQKNFILVLEALKMLENDTLGGSGSRGCGKIAFKEINIKGGGYDSGPHATMDDLLAAVNGAS